MLKSIAGATILLLCLGLPGAHGAPIAQPDLRPFLEIHARTEGTDSPTFTDERISIYQSGALVYQARGGVEGGCIVTTLALGPGSASALRPLRRALRTANVAALQDCGLGFGFGTNLEYQLDWQGLDGRTNDFKFGTFFQSGCPSGVALIKDAVEDYVAAILQDPETKKITSNPCSL
jgi:hypothetical protein